MSEHAESSEIQKLVEALDRQTAAINLLVQSNAQLIQLLVDPDGDDVGGDTSSAYLSGKPR